MTRIPKPAKVVNFHHAPAFWLGTIGVVAGVLAHIPMFVASADMHYHMAGMAMSWTMIAGMYAIIGGTLLVAYGLVPPDFVSRIKYEHDHMLEEQVRALDNSRLTPAHLKLLFVLLMALIIDVMKPATLGFVVPGTALEYGLSKSQVASLPLAGILGTTFGSFIWGWFGDTLGRRASILFAAIIFIGTSICGAMPAYGWNVFMCFMMGFGAGGMLPIVFALMAEIVPARLRGAICVLMGGIGTVGGYLAASAFAAWLEPEFGWRILWLIGLPTGIILILLNRYIPESPRFLLGQGRKREAQAVMQRFGVTVVKLGPGDLAIPKGSEAVAVAGNLTELFRNPLTGLTFGLSTYAIAWGLVNFGFFLWLPLNLREAGMDAAASVAILAKSALIAFPSTLIVAWLYHSWSSRKSLILFAALTALSLLGFVFLADLIVGNPLLMSSLLVALLISSNGMISTLSPYTAEVYPLHIRATGSGWSAGCSKGAGVATLAATLSGFSAGITATALLAAAPALLAAFIVATKGLETRGMSLEKIH